MKNKPIHVVYGVKWGPYTQDEKKMLSYIAQRTMAYIQYNSLQIFAKGYLKTNAELKQCCILGVFSSSGWIRYRLNGDISDIDRDALFDIAKLAIKKYVAFRDLHR